MVWLAATWTPIAIAIAIRDSISPSPSGGNGLASPGWNYSIGVKAMECNIVKREREQSMHKTRLGLRSSLSLGSYMNSPPSS